MSPLYFDLETVARDGAEDFVREPKAKGNLVDPAKIAADLAAKATALRSRLSLDPYGCRIVAAGWTCEETGDIRTRLCHTTDDEMWVVSTLLDLMVTADEIITFNGRSFDVPVVIARAWLLGMDVPPSLRAMVEKRYDGRLIDLYEIVTFGRGRYEDPAIDRKLRTMCRVFDVPVADDDVDGSQIAALVAAGDWEAVRGHVRSDVACTRALAQRLKVSIVHGRTAMAGVGA